MPQQSDVERVYGELASLLSLVREKGDPSDLTAAEVIAAKSLLLSAASHFERSVCSSILRVAEDGGTPEIYCSFIDKQALERKYHTMFNWEANNLNKLFSLFGDAAKAVLANEAKSVELSQPVTDFIYINSQRNKLVHENFAGFSLDATFEDIWAKYRSAVAFTSWFERCLAGLSKPHSPFT